MTSSFDWNFGLGGAGVAYGMNMKPLYIVAIGLGSAYVGHMVNKSSSNAKQNDYAALGVGLGGVLGRMVGSWSMNERYLAMLGGGVGGYWLKGSGS